jgi:hypothetical protein
MVGEKEREKLGKKKRKEKKSISCLVTFNDTVPLNERPLYGYSSNRQIFVAQFFFFFVSVSGPSWSFYWGTGGT